MTVDELHTKMEAGFQAIRTEIGTDLAEFRKHVDAAVKAEAETTRRHFDAAAKAEGETTRRHFDVVAEQFKDYTKVLADGTARNTERLNDHETRITTLEGRSS